jgi:endonuclease YncB( thermonuclease family)
MPPKPLTPATYDRLRDDLQSIVEQAKTRSKLLLARELVLAYWNVGKRIAREKLPESAGYGDSIMARLSADLDINLRTLQQARLFYRTYKKPPAPTTLSWAHYREFLRLRDPDERLWYEQLALEQSLTAKQLGASITADRYASRAPGAPGTGSRPGAAPDAAPAPATLERPTTARYTYKAMVEHVVDGDTLLLLIDLGFEVLRRQRVRLAGIDAEPPNTASGARAQAFVRDRLARTDFVLVKTNRVDLYGRYVGHVFYSLKPADPDRVLHQGIHLNQELLDRNLAVPV